VNPSRRRRALQRPLVPPPILERDVGPDALRAGYGAHKGDQHDGKIGRGCRTCSRYLAALTAARAAQRQADPTP
jgi:hypothetical protein